MIIFTLVFDERNEDLLTASVLQDEQGKAAAISPTRLLTVLAQGIANIAIEMENGATAREVSMEPAIKSAFDIAAENAKKFGDKILGRKPGG